MPSSPLPLGAGGGPATLRGSRVAAPHLTVGRARIGAPLTPLQALSRRTPHPRAVAPAAADPATARATGCPKTPPAPTRPPHHACWTRRGRRGARPPPPAAGAAAADGPADATPPARLPGLPALTPHARAVAALAVATILLGSANRVLYKAALDACGGAVASLYLAALQGAAPAAVYGAVLKLREWRRCGGAAAAAAKAQHAAALHTSRWRLASVGAGEAASSALSFAAAARLPGAILPLLQQSMLLWQLAFERVVLGRAQPRRRVAGVATVIAGVCLAAWPRGGWAAGVRGNAAAGNAAAVIPLDAVLMFAGAMAFPAVAFLTKEGIFAEAAEAAGGVPLDVYALAARTSAVQAACILALLPVAALASGVPFHALAPTLATGVGRVLGPAAPSGGVLPLAYVAMNIAFNVALITLVRVGGALAAGIAAAVLVPVATAAFCVPWPGLPPPAKLGPLFALGVCVSVAGLGLVLASPANGGKDPPTSAPLVLGEEEP